MDLVLANYGSNQVSLLVGQGDGTFATQEIYAVGDNPRSVTSADVDNDGRMDLYVVQSGPFPPDGSETAANRLFFNRGGGRFESAGPDFGAALPEF